MSRRERGGRREGRTSAASRPPRTREAGAPVARAAAGPRRTGWRWVSALLLLAAVVLLAIHPWKAKPPVDPLAGLDLNVAADSADALHKRGKFLEALVYVDYLERVGQPTAAFESRAASASNNATIEVREKDGLVIPATRSSVERVALLRESIRRSHVAEDLDSRTPLRVAFGAARAGQLAVWGFVREAYLEYRRAAALGPLPARALSEARWVEVHLADPTAGLGSPSPVEPMPGSADSTLDPSAGSPPRPQPGTNPPVPSR